MIDMCLRSWPGTIKSQSVERGHQIKAIREYGVPFAVGLAAALVVVSLLSALWFYLGWRKPVADWMIAIGLPTAVAGYWGLVWVNLPLWVVAFGTGLAVGAMRRLSSWLGVALAACVGFVLIPEVLYQLMVGFVPWVLYRPSVVVTTFLFHAVSIPLILLGVRLMCRHKRPKALAAVDGTGSLPQTTQD